MRRLGFSRGIRGAWTVAADRWCHDDGAVTERRVTVSAAPCQARREHEGHGLGDLAGEEAAVASSGRSLARQRVRDDALPG
jgi:hypothetical protein